MAEFIPSLQDISNDRMEKHTEGELALLNALQALSDDYQIYFQPHINFAHPDIIILHKAGGALIIEVKDWDLSAYQFYPGGKIQNDYLVLRNESGKVKSPFTQAGEYKDEFYSILKPSILSERVRLGKNEKNLYSVIRTSVFFYNASQSDVKRLYNTNNYLDIKDGNKRFREHYYYWCREDLTGIAESISELIGKRHTYFTKPIQEAVQKILTLSEEWMEQTEPFDPDKLNSIQKDLIKPTPNRMTKVKGVAGSGKTLVIAFKAINCYKEYGSPVLILTYNITLENYIRDAIAKQTREMSQRERSLAFEIIHYDAFIPQVFEDIAIEGPHPNDYKDLFGEIDWKQYHRDADHLLRMYNKLLVKNNRQYKTVLIDEAQDYEREWFKLIEDCFFLPEADFLIVADQKQNIYQREDFMRKLPVVPGTKGPWRTLSTSYRLSHETVLIARDFMNANMPEYGDDELDEIQTGRNGTIEYHDLSNISTDLYNKIWMTIDSFKPNGENIARNDICVLFGEIYQIRDFEYSIRQLTDNGVKFQIMCETTEEYNDIVALSKGNKTQEKTELWNIRHKRKKSFRMNPGTIKLCTIHSFKGWEINNVVIVLDKNPKIRKEHIYTALTRSKCNILIIDLGGNEFGSYFKAYVGKMKNRIPLPNEYEFSEKPTDFVFSTKYKVCHILERIDKNGLRVEDEHGRLISLDFDYYRNRNQACYIKPANPPVSK